MADQGQGRQHLPSPTKYPSQIPFPAAQPSQRSSQQVGQGQQPQFVAYTGNGLATAYGPATATHLQPQDQQQQYLAMAQRQQQQQQAQQQYAGPQPTSYGYAQPQPWQQQQQQQQQLAAQQQQARTGYYTGQPGQGQAIKASPAQQSQQQPSPSPQPSPQPLPMGYPANPHSLAPARGRADGAVYDASRNAMVPSQQQMAPTRLAQQPAPIPQPTHYKTQPLPTQQPTQYHMPQIQPSAYGPMVHHQQTMPQQQQQAHYVQAPPPHFASPQQISPQMGGYGQLQTMPPTFAMPSAPQMGYPPSTTPDEFSRKRALQQPGSDPSEEQPGAVKRPRTEGTFKITLPIGQAQRQMSIDSPTTPSSFAMPQQPARGSGKASGKAPGSGAKGKGKKPAVETDSDSDLDLDLKFPIQKAKPLPLSTKPGPVRSTFKRKPKSDPFYSSDPSDFNENEVVTNKWIQLFSIQTDMLRRKRIEGVLNEFADSEKQEGVKFQRRFLRKFKRWRDANPNKSVVDEKGEVQPSLDDPWPLVSKQEAAATLKAERALEKESSRPKIILKPFILDLEVSDDEKEEARKVAFVEMGDHGDGENAVRVSDPKELEGKRYAVWDQIVRRHVGQAHALRQQNTQAREFNALKVAQLCAQQAKRMGMVVRRLHREMQVRQRKLTKEMQVFWRKNEKEEREKQKRAEKERQEALKREEEAREAKRQQKKLNFLIQQTELYAHFVAKIQDKSGVSSQPAPPAVEAESGNFKAINFDEESDEALTKRAEASAMAAFERTKERAKEFDTRTRESQAQAGAEELSFQNPTMMPGSTEIAQPKMLKCELKAYQLKGLNWLVNLWESGINGILADEMGLGKTVQSISVLAHLAEVHNIWGPFLVIAPLSTVHNWHQELTKFTPDLKVLPYWGKASDRKELRKQWARKNLYHKNSPFHVLVTSYQVVMKDESYFQKVKWQYMILDEAQAVKSSTTQRWAALQKLPARNRLLLTGTPIQNSMQELWALLHFIMPTLFDSHEEFSEWFSKGIEGAAQDMNTLNEHQLKRLHMILRPFMLRRVKRDVENELGEKIEIEVACGLTPRQRKLYKGLRDKLSIADLLDRLMLGEVESNESLMNLVMQFRKVCNHPELFERLPVISPMVMFSQYPDPLLMASKNDPSSKIATWVNRPPANPIQLDVPRLVYEQEGLAGLNEGDQERGRVMEHLCNVLHPENVVHEMSKGHSEFGFLRFAGLSPAEADRITKEPVLMRVVDMLLGGKQRNRLAVYEDLEGPSVSSSASLLIAPHNPLSPEQLSQSSVLKDLCSVYEALAQESRLRRETPAYTPAVVAAPVDLVCHSRSFVYDVEDLLWDRKSRGLLSGTELLLPGGRSDPANKDLIRVIEDETDGVGLVGPPATTQGFSHILTPAPDKLIYDSSKMTVIDQMLPQLKAEGHRVLIFFQMVRMIDLFAEYLASRNYSYVRLDGKTDVTERNAKVVAFQNNPEIFIFLLSTRAGGLGINLTAADTVIFYDSDWNPTADQQAMDRCHRLGQTRQVTVYRMVTKGTIEERILNRAKQKDHVQKVVISGSGQAQFQARDIAALLLDDDELAENLKIREAERAREAKEGKGRRGRPPKSAAVEVDAAAKRKRLGDDDEDGFDADNFDMVDEEPAQKKRRRGGQSWAKDELAEGGGAPKVPKKRGRKPKPKPAAIPAADAAM